MCGRFLVPVAFSITLVLTAFPSEGAELTVRGVKLGMSLEEAGKQIGIGYKFRKDSDGAHLQTLVADSEEFTPAELSQCQTEAHSRRKPGPTDPGTELLRGGSRLSPGMRMYYLPAARSAYQSDPQRPLRLPLHPPR